MQEKNISIKLFLAVITIFIPIAAIGQIHHQNNSSEFKSNLRISISSQFLLQRSSEIQTNAIGFAENPSELFYQNPVFSLNADWYPWPFIAISPRLAYYSGSDSHFEDRRFVQIGFPGLYTDNYDFRLFLLEPGIKISIPFKGMEAFWSGNFTLGFGTLILNAKVTPVRYENGEAVPQFEDTATRKFDGHSTGTGFSFSTGISYPVSASLCIQAEIGYRFLNLDEFNNRLNFKLGELNYKLDSLVPGVGITYVIR